MQMKQGFIKQGLTVKNAIRLVMLFALLAILFQLSGKVALADNKEIYKDGIYCYTIIDESNKEVRLVGVEQKDAVKEFQIPGTALINGTEYKVAAVNISYEYYENNTYAKFYKNVEKLTISEDFTGSLYNLIYVFGKVRTVEFKGTTPPKEAYFELLNGFTHPDILFVVPKGTEKAYSKVIKETMQYSSLSDLYEHPIELVPVITSDAAAKVEDGCFNYGNYIFQVTSSAKNGTGTVQLIGLQKARQSTYLSLPEKVTNDGYTYKLTRLGLFSLVYSGAITIVVPDTVTEMNSYVFDKFVEVLFLSKNCKTLPRGLITNENGESNLRFVYVPEGVTTIAEGAFNNIGSNKASIILPSTIKSLGKKSLYLFDYVTFLNKKPISNIKAAIANGTTVKVPSASIKTYKAALSSKVSVIAAKNVVKSSKLTTADQSISLKLKKTYTEKAALSKASNETVFWLSTDTNIITVSSTGKITAKGTGTAYVLAYTRTSGLHKVIKVTVTK